MLDDDAGGRFELLDALERGVAVRNVVVRQRLALQLRRAGQRALRCLLVDVERRILVRVLAVAHAIDQRACVQEALAQRVVAERVRQVFGDRRVVTRRVRIGFGREPAAHVRRQTSSLQCLEDAVVVGRVNDDGDAFMVFRRRANHRRAADVDVLDRVFDRRVVARDGLFERVEVDRQQVDRLDAVFFHHRIVCAAAAQQTAMNLRVQRLDAAIHDFGKAGLVTDLDDVDACVTQCAAGATGGENFNAKLGKAAANGIRPCLSETLKSARRTVNM